ncbi:hypothetical protein LSUE1_G009190 [Lachnellula suecica]|uniref:Uncharacterized protein n=1 Tax=Lachnellula suecica TaxID=602035 RepID=A0A8T9BTJ5_9HELO|nr:hypothetical protein LSUE1_G009190 [Lachnellula suecica]
MTTMFASTFRWLQRKRYQYEVTFSLYMLTPTEKFIFSKPAISSIRSVSAIPASLSPSLLPAQQQLTPILDSFLFLFFSMIIIAMTLYLPQHIAFLTNRAWFYYNGEESAKLAGASATSTVMVEKVRETVAMAANAGAGSTIMGAAKEL